RDGWGGHGIALLHARGRRLQRRLRRGVPNPCAVVPSAEIAAALGRKSAPHSTLSAVNTTATCSYGTSLTLFVGYTAIANPATPALVAAVPGLPHGHFMTYKGSTQTEVLFFVGSAATGVYGV